MFFNRKAARQPTPPEQIRRIVTSGFASSTMDKADVFFVEAEKHDDGIYVLYATRNYTTNGQPGYRRQVLTEHHSLKDALETMAEWEHLSRVDYAVDGRSTGRDAPHFTAVAKQLDIAVGHDMTSHSHACRMKRLYAARRRAPGQSA